MAKISSFGRLNTRQPVSVDPAQVHDVSYLDTPAAPPQMSADFIAPINQPAPVAPEPWKPNMLRVLDGVLGGGMTFSESANSERERHRAELQRPQMEALRQRLLDEVGRSGPDAVMSYLTNPTEFGKNMATRLAAADVAAGSSRVYGNPEQGGNVFTAPKIDTAAGQAFSYGPDGVKALGAIPFVPDYVNVAEGGKAVPKTPILPPGFAGATDPTAGLPRIGEARPVATAGQPRSVRNNNPGNLEDGPFTRSQPGYKGTDGRFAIFDTPDAGHNAQVALLSSYGNRGIDTVEGIINRWAPPTENDTGGYVNFVAQKVGVKPGDRIDMSDPGVLGKVAGAIRQFEGGPASKSNGPPVLAGAAPAPATPGGDPPGTLYGTPKADSEDIALSPDAVDLLAGKYISTGALPPLGMGKTAAANRSLILNRATAMAKDLGLNADDLVAGTATVKALGASLNRITIQRNATAQLEQTASRNADLMLSLAEKGGGTTNIPVLNRWIQAGRKNIAGDPDVTSFDNALGAFSEEFAKVMTGNLGNAAATEGARHDAAERLGRYATQGQLKAGIATMKVEMANRMEALHEVENGIRANIRNGGRDVGPSPGGEAPPSAPTSAPRAPGWSRALPTPQLEAARKFKGASAPAGDPKNPFVPRNAAEFKNIPPGKSYVDDDGSIQVKR